MYKKRGITIIFMALASMVLGQPTQSPDRYTPELLWKLGRVSEAVTSEANNSILYGVTWYDLVANKGNRDLYLLKKNATEPVKVTSFKGSEQNGIFTPDGKKIAFLSAEGGETMQIWEANLDGSNPVQISHFENDVQGFSYSPAGNKLLAVMRIKLDKTVNDMYSDLPKANARLQDDLMYRHWDSWRDFSYNHIFVADYANGKATHPVDIMDGEHFDSPMMPMGGMEQIAWSPDGKSIAYTCKKLSGQDYAVSTNSEIYLYDLQTQKTSNISKPNPGYDQNPVFSPDGKRIAWQSMARNGYEADKNRIFVYDLATQKVKDYSENFDQSANSFLWSKDGKYLYFISGIKGTEHIFGLDLATTKIRQITTGDCDYTAISLLGDQIIATRMSMLDPIEIYSIDIANGKATQLTFTNKEILKSVKSAKVEKRWVTTTDNKQMLTWVILPPDFDPNKKYATLLFCEGGPQTTVSQFFSYRWNFQIMAANDYIVVAPNRRGLPSFGQEWCDQISGDYGGQNMKDYLSAIDDMAKEPYVDKDHLGAVGASYGGFSVFWLAGHHEKRFKAFLAHCGMFNLEDQYLTTEEMFFVNWDLGGPYWDKKSPAVQHSYANSPHLFVDKWDTPIMVIHGENDFRIPYTQGMAAYNAAKLRGIPARFLTFPDENHWVLKPQNGVLWQREYFRWLDQWLKK